jgi:hypothetical protein
MDAGGGGDWSVFSRIMVEDYIVWVQLGAREKVLQVLASEMEKVKIELGDVGFNLEEEEGVGEVG